MLLLTLLVFAQGAWSTSDEDVRDTISLLGKADETFSKGALKEKSLPRDWVLAECSYSTKSDDGAGVLEFRSTLCGFMTGMSPCGGIFSETYVPLEPSKLCTLACRPEVENLLKYRSALQDISVSQRRLVKEIIDVILDRYEWRCRMGSNN